MVAAVLPELMVNMIAVPKDLPKRRPLLLAVVKVLMALAFLVVFVR